MTDIAAALQAPSPLGCIDLGTAGEHHLAFLPIIEGVLRACCDDCGAAWVLGTVAELGTQPLVELLTAFRDGVANGLEAQTVVPELVGCLTRTAQAG